MTRASVPHRFSSSPRIRRRQGCRGCSVSARGGTSRSHSRLSCSNARSRESSELAMPEIASSLVTITEDAVREALEQMFFLVVLGRREAAGMPTADAVAAELAFTGEACGVFRLALSRQTAAEATAN